MKFSIATALLMGTSAVSATSLRRDLQTGCGVTLDQIVYTSTECSNASVFADFRTAMDSLQSCNKKNRQQEAMLLTKTTTLAEAKAVFRGECVAGRTKCIADLTTLSFNNCTGSTLVSVVETALDAADCEHGVNAELRLHATPGLATNREVKAEIVDMCETTLTKCLASIDVSGTDCSFKEITTVIEDAVDETCTHSVNQELLLQTGEATVAAAKKALRDSCLANRKACTTWNDDEITTCNSNKVFKAIKAKLDALGDTCPHGLNAEIRQLFGTTKAEAVGIIQGMCDNEWDFSAAPHSKFEDIDTDFDDAFMNQYTAGDTFLNLERGNFRRTDNPQFPRGSYNADTRATGANIRNFRQGDAQTTVLDPVQTLSTCQHQSAMCCFKYDRQSNDNNGDCNDGDCTDQGPGDNSQLCGVTDNEAQENIHCHGFAWDSDANNPSSVFKFNNFFFVSLFDHMYTRGYVENVVDGTPMCGCIGDNVETTKMPPVSRSDCTQIDVAQTFLLNQDANGYLVLAKKDSIFELNFNACQGINADGEAQNNDLAAYVNRLNIEGRIADATQDVISQTLIGGNNEACDQ